MVALELMRQRAMRDTERRLAGDVLAEALTGRPSANELAVRLRPFGVGAEAAVLVFASPDGAPPAQAEGDLDRFLADAGVGALVAVRERLLCAVVDASEETGAVALAARAREALMPEHGELRAAASRPAPVGSLRRTFHEARCALEAAGLANGSAPPVASYRDLGAFQLLLSLQDDDALRLYCDSVLGPLEDGSGEYGDGSALARGVHRAERPVGEGGTRALLPPSYAALPDTEGRGADRQGPVERPRPHRVLAGAARPGVSPIGRT